MAGTGSRLASVARQSLVYGLGSVIGKVAGLLLLPLYTHYLRPVDYGRVELILALATAAQIVLQLGLVNSFFRFWFDADTDEHRHHVFRVTFSLLMVTSSVAAIVVAVIPAPFAYLILHQHGAEPDRLIQIGALGMWINTNYEVMAAMFRVKQQPVAYTVATLLNLFATVGCTVLFVVGFGMRASGLLLGNFLGSVAVYLGLLIMRREWLGFARGGKLMREMLQVGYPMMFAGVALWLVNLINRPMVNAIDGAAALGIFAVGFKLAQAITIFVQAFQLSWPAFSMSITDDDDARHTYAAVLSAYVAFMGWIVTILGALAPFIIHAVVNRRFWGGIPTVVPLAAGQALYGSFFIASIGTLRSKKTRSNWVISLIAAGVEIALLLVLVKPFGVAGAAWSVAGAYLAMFLLMLYQSNQHFYVPWQWRRLVQVSAVVAGLVAAASLVSGTSPLGVGLRSIAVVAYPIVLLATGFLTPSQLRTVRARIARRPRAAT